MKNTLDLKHTSMRKKNINENEQKKEMLCYFFEVMVKQKMICNIVIKGIRMKTTNVLFVES